MQNMKAGAPIPSRINNSHFEKLDKMVASDAYMISTWIKIIIKTAIVFMTSIGINLSFFIAQSVIF